MLSAASYPKIPPNLKGVKHSRTANSTSLGIDCLDKLVEDGIPFPSIILIDERNSRKISKILQRIYVAEGVSHEQKVIACSPRKQNLEELLDSVPIESTETSMDQKKAAATAVPEESLKIAWRFQSAPQINSSISNSKPRFDLAKSKSRMDVVDYVRTITCNSYEQLWKNIEAILNSSEVDITQNGSKTPHRIILSELGSPLFMDSSKAAITNFITRLRAYVMSSCATVLITIDGAQLDSETLASFHLISDSVLNFHPTPERLRSNDPSSFAGRLEVAKMPRAYGNSLFRPEFCDYSYKDTRHTVEIRKLHLDFDDSSSGNAVDAKAVEPITDDLRELGILAPDVDED